MKAEIALLIVVAVAIVVKPTIAKPKPISFNIRARDSLPSVREDSAIDANLAYSSYAQDYTDELDDDFIDDESTDGASSDILATGGNVYNQIFNDILDGIVEAKQVGADGLRTLIGSPKLRSEIRSYGQSIGENLRGSISSQIVNRFRSTLGAVITNVDQHIANVRNRYKRQALSEVRSQLLELATSFDDVQDLMVEVREKLSGDIKTQENAALKSWNSWASEVLQNADELAEDNEDVLNDAEHLVNELLVTYSSYMKTCVSEVEEDLQEYEGQFSNAVKQYKLTLDLLSKQTQSCLNSRDTNLEGRRCSRQITEQLRKLSPVQEEFSLLGEAGGRLMVDRNDQRYCVTQTLTDFEIEKQQVEEQIEKLLDDTVSDDKAISPRVIWQESEFGTDYNGSDDESNNGESVDSGDTSGEAGLGDGADNEGLNNDGSVDIESELSTNDIE